MLYFFRWAFKQNVLSEIMDLESIRIDPSSVILYAILIILYLGVKINQNFLPNMLHVKNLFIFK